MAWPPVLPNLAGAHPCRFGEKAAITISMSIFENNSFAMLSCRARCDVRPNFGAHLPADATNTKRLYFRAVGWPHGLSVLDICSFCSCQRNGYASWIQRMRSQIKRSVLYGLSLKVKKNGHASITKGVGIFHSYHF